MASDPGRGASGSCAAYWLQKRRHQEATTVTPEPVNWLSAIAVQYPPWGGWCFSLKSSTQSRFNPCFCKWMWASQGQIARDFFLSETKKLFAHSGYFSWVSRLCLQPHTQLMSVSIWVTARPLRAWFVAVWERWNYFMFKKKKLRILSIRCN